MQNNLGPRAGHSEECRLRLEQAIAGDGDDDRQKKVKERLDHYTAELNKEEEEKERVKDPRTEEPMEVQEVPKVQEKEELVGPERFLIGSPEKGVKEDDSQEFDDGPTSVSERKVRTPMRNSAPKRKESIHSEEPDTKKIILGDLTDDEDGDMADISAIEERRVDEKIVSQAILGKDLHDVYSNARVRLAIERQSAEHMMKLESAAPEVGGQLAGVIGGQPGIRKSTPPEVGVLLTGVEEGPRLDSTDVAELFSPERVGLACSKFGLVQGAAMDIKSGYDFDIAADRARCWDKIMEEKPMLVIGSPPCTLFSRLQELNKFMYSDNKLWMEKFQERMQQAKRYVNFCLKIYEHQISQGRYFLHACLVGNELAVGGDRQVGGT